MSWKKNKNIVLADLLGDYPLLYGGQFVQSSQDDLSTKRKQYNSNSTKYGCIVYTVQYIIGATFAKGHMPFLFSLPHAVHFSTLLMRIIKGIEK